MTRLLTADKLKLIHSKKLILLLLASFLLPVIQGINTWLTLHSGHPLILSKEIVINGASAVLIAKKNAFSLFVLFLVTSSFFIGEEFQNGTIRNPLALGISREKFYFSKWITLIRLASLSLLVMTSTAYLIYTFLFGFGSLPASTGRPYFSYAIITFVVQLFLLSANVSIYLMISFLCQQIGPALIWTSLYTVLMGFLPGLFLKTEHFRFLTDWVSQTHLLYQDFTVLDIWNNYPQMVLVSFLTSVLSCWVGIFLFKKFDIK